eukprot:3952863-Prymnesium_polylepis.1
MSVSRDEKAERDEQRRKFNEKVELAELRAVFDTLDRNRDDKIDAVELNNMLSKLEHKAKKQEIEDMIWEVDENGDGCVDWQVLWLVWSACPSRARGIEWGAVNIGPLLRPNASDTGLCNWLPCAGWQEFQLMFNRCRADKTGYEPRQLFNVVEFMMHDKDHGGTIDVD